MAVYRSYLYGFLARVFRNEPDAELVAVVNAEPFLDALSEIGIRFDSKFSKEPKETIIENLAVEFTRLFLGPGPHISPHESVHHELKQGKWGTLWGDSTVEVKKFMESAGMNRLSHADLLPDHVSVELEFMQLLTQREAQERKKRDDINVKYCFDMEKYFIEWHLYRWVPSFCDKIISSSDVSFFRTMAELTKNFIEFEKKNIDSFSSEKTPN